MSRPAELQRDSTPLQHVDETSWGGHQQVTALVQVPHLVADAGATVHNARPDVGPVKWSSSQYHEREMGKCCQKEGTSSPCMDPIYEIVRVIMETYTS